MSGGIPEKKKAIGLAVCSYISWLLALFIRSLPGAPTGVMAWVAAAGIRGLLVAGIWATLTVIGMTTTPATSATNRADHARNQLGAMIYFGSLLVCIVAWIF